jgi:hypothetical protein
LVRSENTCNISTVYTRHLEWSYSFCPSSIFIEIKIDVKKSF